MSLDVLMGVTWRLKLVNRKGASTEITRGITP